MNDLAKDLSKATGKSPDMYYQNKTSKHEKIKNWLIKHGSITPSLAWKMFGCYRLSSVINRLRNKGLNIKTEIQYSGDDQFAKYKLISND